jgi:transcriptional regulator with XRE-family HTH domain
MRYFEHIAQLIRTKRTSHPKGYSQSELSHMLGYKNGQFISNVERALCNIPLKMLKRVSEVLDVTPEELKEAILKDQEYTLDVYLREGDVDHMDTVPEYNQESIRDVRLQDSYSTPTRYDQSAFPPKEKR